MYYSSGRSDHGNVLSNTATEDGWASVCRTWSILSFLLGDRISSSGMSIRRSLVPMLMLILLNAADPVGGTEPTREWSRIWGGSGDESGRSVDVDSLGNICYSSQATVGDTLYREPKGKETGF